MSNKDTKASLGMVHMPWCTHLGCDRRAEFIVIDESQCSCAGELRETQSCAEHIGSVMSHADGATVHRQKWGVFPMAEHAA